MVRKSRTTVGGGCCDTGGAAGTLQVFDRRGGVLQGVNDDTMGVRGLHAPVLLNFGGGFLLSSLLFFKRKTV